MQRCAGKVTAEDIWLTTEYGTFTRVINESYGLISHGSFFNACNYKQSNFLRKQKDFIMAFFNSAVGVLQTLVIALGAGLGIWGVVNLMEGYGNDNPRANAHVR